MVASGSWQVPLDPSQSIVVAYSMRMCTTTVASGLWHVPLDPSQSIVGGHLYEDLYNNGGQWLMAGTS